MAARCFRTPLICSVAALAMAIATVTVAQGRGLKLRNAQTEPLSFADLDGWAGDDHTAAFAAFGKSCNAILKGSKAMRAKRPVYGGLFAACQRAVSLNEPANDVARKFFEDNFRAVRIARTGEAMGFLTGYYETEFEGSRFPSPEYSVPLYAPPPDLVMPAPRRARKAAGTVGRRVGHKTVSPYHNRNAIEDGILAGKQLEICWVKSPIDAFFAQIQGSTRIRLDSGKLLRLNYAAHNGLPYVAVGKFLIDRGIVSKEEMSMDKIRDFMEADPVEGRELRRKNQSFVFFREVALAAHEEPVGAQGVPLTPGRSIAVDKSIHVYGTPFWIEAELPIDSEKPETRFRRLMIAQDTGSAIIGPARADIYFGAGEEIGHAAGRIKQYGKFVMLVPRAVQLDKPNGKPKADPNAKTQEPSGTVPVPRSRPSIAVDNGTDAKKATGIVTPPPRPKS